MSHSDRAAERDSSSPYSSLHEQTDARALRALAHPTRIALLEAVVVHGPITATEAARIVGGTVANASYHLRMLAKYDYVVAAEGRTGRERPWQIGTVGMILDADNPDPTVSHATRALGGIVMDRWLSRRRHYDSHHEDYSDEVRAASGSSQFVVFGTTAEIEKAQTEIAKILMGFMDRVLDPTLRPEGSLPFEVLVSTHPFPIPVSTDPEG